MQVPFCQGEPNRHHEGKAARAEKQTCQFGDFFILIKEDLKPQKTQTCLWGRGEDEMVEKGRELEASEIDLS